MQLTKEDKDRINFIIEQYESISPNYVKTEDLDGSFYPKDIKPPDIAYVPPAEPHVLVTDGYENEEDWYAIEAIIPELAEQALVSYYNGLYQASFMSSLNCIELTLKYELVRNKILNSADLEKGNMTLGNIINQDTLQKLKLENHHKDLDLLNKARIGLFHFNPEKLKEATVNILLNKKPKKGIKLVNLDMETGKTFETTPEENYYVPSDNLDDWSRFAYFSYSLMYQITKQFYGKERKPEHIKAGLDDYRKKRESEKGALIK